MITNQILATYPFFSRLSAESRRLIDASARIRLAARKECLLRKGERIRGLYLVLSGRLRVYTISPAGREASLYVIEPGESCPLAMNAMLSEKLHQAWVEVGTKTAKILFIPSVVFRDLYENERAVREFALSVLSGRISSLMTVLEELSLQSVEERVKGYLLRCANNEGEIETTHQQIALALGTAREVISRKLRELVRAGSIEARRGRIKILSPHKLERDPRPPSPRGLGAVC
jgi:CRP/FNR family transcriptional regulator